MEGWEEDIDVRTAVDWFLSFFEAGEWERRRVTAEGYLRSLPDVSVVLGRRLTGDKIRAAAGLRPDDHD
jgi:hypothetical protein